jgi:hypothetical protein
MAYDTAREHAAKTTISRRAHGGGALIFQRNEAIISGRVATTWPNEMIAAGSSFYG